MATPQRDSVESIIDALAVVTGSNTWTFHRYEPFHNAGDADHCAVWYAGGQVRGPEFNSTGHQDIAEEYHVQFWRQAPEGPGGVIVDEAGLAVETILDAVKDVIYDNEDGITGLYDFQWDQESITIGGDAEAKIIGFEIVCIGKRTRHFT